MERTLLIFVLAFPLMSLAQERKVLIIGIDGCRGDAILAADAPNLQGLAASGFSTFEANTHPPTWSGTGWSTMLTGVWEQKHKVVDNSFTNAQFVAWPHFFQRLTNVNGALDLRSIVHWGPINTQITTGADQELNLGTDQLVADSAVELLQNGDPDVLFLQFDDVDHAGHTFGFSPDLSEYVAAIDVVDQQIGPILAAVAARPASEQWMVMVTTDHGGNLSGHGGNTFDEQRIFIIANGPGINAEERDATHDVLPIPTAMEFGANKYVRTTNDLFYQFGATDDFSIECNVKMPATWAGDPVFVGNKDWDNGNNPGFVLSTTGTGFNWKFNLGDGTDRVDLTGLPINDGEWHHLAVTCDRDGEARIFQDGLLMGSADMSAIGDVNTAFPICFGQDGTTTYGSALTGTVSGVRIWRKALDINTVSAWSGKPISALHPDVTFLIGEWPMNEGTGGLLTNAVTLQEDAQFYNGANAVDATWMSNTTPLTTTDLTRTPTQADVVPTILEYLCITEYTDWPLDGQPLIEGCVSTAVEERASNSVLLFPNPSRDRITIRSSKANGLFILSDATGRSVMTTKLIGTSTTIGIDHLPTGPYQYVLRALDGQVQERGMLVKQ
ncbi:MAG: alkaline phosphatase family protein [Flavobacteriales bacterium]|nr:alkaline phosphatase family protein [Flavobacteriales bacterium]